MLIDSHSHIFLDDFSDDLPEVINRAKQSGVSHIFLPNIDHETIESVKKVSEEYKDFCYPMIGVHPTSIGEDYDNELQLVKQQLDSKYPYVAIGEIGIDLYWDKTFLKQQLIAFEQQIKWALEYDLPIVIHSRESFNEVCGVLEKYKDTSLRGIFHSFTGTAEDVKRLLEFQNFMIGINGVVTFKKSTLPEVLKIVPLSRVVVETDSPYLTPAPNRGKRNASASIK